MAYINGASNAAAAAKLPYLVKGGVVAPTDRYEIDDAKPNNWREFADNVAGTAKIHYFIGVDPNNQTYLNNPNGVNAFALALVQLPTPATPTITNVGTAGSTSDAYKIVALSGRGATLGSTPASAAGSTSTANATLSATNYNVITFAAVTGAAYYNIYRTTAAGTPSTTGLIGSVTATVAIGTGVQPTSYTFNDTGLVGDGSTAPTANTTGVLSAPTFSGGISIPVLSTPVNVVATPQGTAGSTTITYKLVARGVVGTTAASSAATTTTANATLTAGNNVLVTWDAVPEAVSYDVYRTAAGGTPSTTGLVANVLAPLTSYTDVGGAGDSSTPPSTNTTGALNLAQVNDTSGNAEIILTATASAVNQVTLANAATANAPSLTASGSDTNIGINILPKGTTNASLVGVGDAGTATASAGAATLSKQRGVVTSEALSTAAGATYTLTLTNTKIATTSILLVNVGLGTATTGQPTVASVVPGSGSATIVIQNIHASAALNGTIKVQFLVAE